MKRSAIAFVLIAGLALIVAFIPQAAAQAKCYDAQKQPIPCPKTKSDYSLKQPTDTPVPTSTETSAASQSSVLSGQPACPSPVAAALPPSEPWGLPSFPWLLGGGGLLGGALLGLMVGRSGGQPRTNPPGPAGGFDMSKLSVEDAALVIMEIVSDDGHQDMRDMLKQMDADRKKKRGLRQAADALKQQESAGDLDALTQDRLQAGMDRRNKFMDTLSNLLKKQQDTDDGVLKNLK